MPVIDLGKVVGNPGASMRFRGEWLSGSEYFNNESYIDTVTHNGSLWICKTTNTGQEPIEGDYWGMGAYGTVTGFDATISIPATGWSGSSAPYAQTVSVSGMTATKAVVYALVSNSETPTDTENSNYGKITGISQNTNSVTFYAAEKPTADIVIRAFSGADTEQAADLSIIAEPFDAASSYATGDYTLYEGQMYKFTENKDPGAWDTSKVTLTTVSDELKSQAAELASQAEDIADLNSSMPQIHAGSYVPELVSGGDSLTVSSGDTQYFVVGNLCFLSCALWATINNPNADDIKLSLPPGITPISRRNYGWVGYHQSKAIDTMYVAIDDSGSGIVFEKPTATGSSGIKGTDMNNMTIQFSIVFAVNTSLDL